MRRNELAIADVLRHKEFGLVSHQPDLRKKIDQKDKNTGLEVIRVATPDRKIFFVNINDCERAPEERDIYWQVYNNRKSRYEYIANV